MKGAARQGYLDTKRELLVPMVDTEYRLNRGHDATTRTGRDSVGSNPASPIFFNGGSP